MNKTKTELQKENAARPADMKARIKANKHADMCVAFHERLVEALQTALDNTSVLTSESAKIDYVRSRDLLVEIEKANQ